jgi:hypothetical protein
VKRKSGTGSGVHVNGWKPISYTGEIVKTGPGWSCNVVGNIHHGHVEISIVVVVSE